MLVQYCFNCVMPAITNGIIWTCLYCETKNINAYDSQAN